MRREISEAKPVETKKQGTLEASVGKSFERLLENKGEKAEKKIEHNTTESFAKTEVNISRLKRNLRFTRKRDCRKQKLVEENV